MEFWTAHLLTYWIYVGFLLLLLSMDSLPSCVSPDLPKNEFVQKLIHLPTSELLRLRLALFNEAFTETLSLPDYYNLPLVQRKDTAIKPVSYKLSEDIWTVVSHQK